MRPARLRLKSSTKCVIGQMDRSVATWQSLRAQLPPQGFAERLGSHSPRLSRNAKALPNHMHTSERASILAELTPPYALLQPARTAGTGRILLAAFRAHLSQGVPGGFPARSAYPAQIRGLLRRRAVRAGGRPRRPLIAARFPRAYLDVNREPYELDPSFHRPATRLCQYPIGPCGGRARHHRHASLPTPRRSTESGCRSGPPSSASSGSTGPSTRAGRSPGGRPASASASPSHRLPLDAISLHGSGPGGRSAFRARRPFRRLLRCQAHPLHARYLQAAGYEVQLNRPYAGGFITEYYGNPARGVQSLQLEINRGLYLDERRSRKAGFSEIGPRAAGHGHKGIRCAATVAERRAAAEWALAVGPHRCYVASQYAVGLRSGTHGLPETDRRPSQPYQRGQNLRRSLTANVVRAQNKRGRAEVRAAQV